MDVICMEIEIIKMNNKDPEEEEFNILTQAH